jgi:hypothetical protein
MVPSWTGQIKASDTLREPKMIEIFSFYLIYVVSLFLNIMAFYKKERNRIKWVLLGLNILLGAMIIGSIIFAKSIDGMN